MLNLKKLLVKILESIASPTHTDTYLSLGQYETGAILSAMGGTLRFSIPTGRVLSHATISKISFDMVARNGRSGTNAAANGLYTVKNTASGSGSVTLSSDANGTFYNASNAVKTLTPSMWRKTVQGGTNIFVELASGVDYFFTGTAALNNEMNNQPATVELMNIQVWLS